MDNKFFDIKQLGLVSLGEKYPEVTSDTRNRSIIYDYIVNALLRGDVKEVMDKDDEKQLYVINIVVKTEVKLAYEPARVSPEEFQKIALEEIEKIQKNPDLAEIYIPKEFKLQKTSSGVTDPRLEDKGTIQLAFTMKYEDAALSKEDMVAKIAELESETKALNLAKTKLTARVVTLEKNGKSPKTSNQKGKNHNE